MLSGGVVRSSLSLVGQLSQVESLGGRVDLYGTGECFVEPSWLRLFFFPILSLIGCCLTFLFQASFTHL